MTGITFSDYWDCFYCEEPDATVEDCLWETEDYLKKLGLRDIDIELACCVEKFQFDKAEQLLEQGADPLKNRSELDEEVVDCVTRIYGEIEFINSYFVGMVLGKDKLKMKYIEESLRDLINLAAHEKMDHLLDKYWFDK